MRHYYTEYYEILFFLVFFSGGLIINDFKDAAAFLGMSDHWAQTVYTFLKVDNIDTFKKHILEYEREVERLLKEEKMSESDMLKMLYKNDKDTFRKDLILKILPEDIFNKDNFVVSASEKLRHAITLSEVDAAYAVFKHLIKVMNYFKNLFHAITLKIKSDIHKQESLVESSSLSCNPFWYDNELTAATYTSYVLNKSVNVEEVITFHENSLRTLLISTETFSMYNGFQYVRNKPTYEQMFLKLSEDLLIKILTVYTELSNGESSAEMVSHVRQIIKDAENMGFSTWRIDIKVELNCLSNSCKSLSKNNRQHTGTVLTKVETDQIDQLITNATDLIDRFDSRENLAFKIELLISKYCLYQYNKFKHVQYPLKLISEIVDELCKCVNLIPEEDRIDYDVLKAKVILIKLYSAQTRKEEFGSELKKQAKWAYEEVFKRHKMRKLMIKVGEIRLKNTSNRETKLALAKECLETAKLLFLKEKEKFFDKIIKDIEAEQESFDSNRILLLNCMKIDESYLGDSIMYDMRDLRTLVLEELKRSSKNILLQVDEFSKEALKPFLEKANSCRLCIIDTPVYSNEECAKMTCPIISDDEKTEGSVAHSSSTKSPSPYVAIDILLILGELADYQAQKLMEKSPIRFTINLNFVGKVQSKFDIFGMWLVNEFKYTFVLKFVKQIVSGVDVEQALEHSSKVTIEEVQEKLKKIKLYNLKLNSENDANETMIIDIQKFFFNVIRSQHHHHFKSKIRLDFKEGQLAESPSQYSSNKLYSFHNKLMVKRQAYLSQAIKMLEKNRRINIFGCKDVGKTSILKMLINQCIIRNQYKDGVYYFDLQSFVQNNRSGNIKDLMKVQLGDSFDHEPENYFKNKKMLIIFDDFDIITRDKHLIFPVHLINSLIKNDISVILSSENKIRREDQIERLHCVRVEYLTPEESLCMFLALQIPIFIQHDYGAFKKLLHSKVIKKAKGKVGEICRKSLEFLSEELGIQGDVESSGSEDPTNNRKNEWDTDEAKDKPHRALSMVGKMNGSVGDKETTGEYDIPVIPSIMGPFAGQEIENKVVNKQRYPMKRRRRKGSMKQKHLDIKEFKREKHF